MPAGRLPSRAGAPSPGRRPRARSAVTTFDVVRQRRHCLRLRDDHRRRRRAHRRLESGRRERDDPRQLLGARRDEQRDASGRTRRGSPASMARRSGSTAPATTRRWRTTPPSTSPRAITMATWVKPEKTATQNLIKKSTQVARPANGYELSLVVDGGFQNVRPLQPAASGDDVQSRLADHISDQRHHVDAPRGDVQRTGRRSGCT